jgi:hypothetical protein
MASKYVRFHSISCNPPTKLIFFAKKLDFEGFWTWMIFLNIIFSKHAQHGHGKSES